MIQNIQVCCKKIKIGGGSCGGDNNIIQNQAPDCIPPSNIKLSDTEDESGDDTDNDDEEDVFEETDVEVHGSIGMLSFVHRHAASLHRRQSHDPLTRYAASDGNNEEKTNGLPLHGDPFTLSESSTDEDEGSATTCTFAPFINRSISFRSVGSTATVHSTLAPSPVGINTCIMCEDADAPPATAISTTCTGGGKGKSPSKIVMDSVKKNSNNNASATKNPPWFLFSNASGDAGLAKVVESTSSESDGRSDYGLFDEIGEEYSDGDRDSDASSEALLTRTGEVVSDNEQINIRLSSKDEIHVSPCQCALTLMGMHSSTSSTFNLSVPASTSTRGPGKPPLPPLASQKSSAISSNRPLNEPFELSHSSSFDKHPLLRKPTEYSYFNNSTGTCNRRRILTEDDHTLIPHRKTPSGGSASFHVLGYHEITVIRCEYKDKTLTSHDNDNFPWSVLTIRCSTHDDMDKIIGTLQRAMNGIKVVPFSYDVKERAKCVMKRNRSGSSPKVS